MADHLRLDLFTALQRPSNVIFLSTSVLLCVGWLTLSWGPSYIRNLPLPPAPSVVWGHEKSVYDNEPGRTFRQWFKSLGLTFRIKAAFGAPDVLVLADPVGVTYLLQKKVYDYHHSKVVRPRVARLLGKGLGWVEGEADHRRLKRLSNPSLTSDNIKAMSADITDAALVVVDNLAKHVQARIGDGQPLNILDWTGKAILNIVGRVAFLYDFAGGENAEAQQILQGRRRGASAVKRYASFLMLMLLRRFTFLNDLPIPAIQGQALAKTIIQRGVAKEMVRRNLGYESAGHDLLSKLLAARDEEKLTEEELYEQISTFIVAGFESSTITLGFAIYELARNPALQQRLRDELSAFTGEPTYDDFQNRLPLLDAVLKETLRMYPGLPYMERIATKDDIIPLKEAMRLDDGHVVHEVVVHPGQTVLIPIIAIQRQDAVWKDADTFRPERWFGEMPPKDELCAGWANILAFSDGPRSCIGAKLAIYQIKVVLSMLVSRFEFGEDKSVDVTLKIASALHPWVQKKGAQGTETLRQEMSVYLRAL
ncbi:cytochrome P450 [Amylostereum chailletii]|nr:cytochrome P450 [Amylostereum chailletii]